ncbi:MAG: hypothetical protein IJK89_12200 [Clostridia bacterium]|nr:hypothetical protein [Clostridia bacterium]
MNKYNEVMARVTVSEEMKSRILGSLPSADFKQTKVVRFPNAKRYIALAACFAVVLISVLAVTMINRQPQPGGDLTAGAPVEYQSARELSKASGIEIEDLRDLPFEATQTVYLDYQINLAEINYSNETQSLWYRASRGGGDNSGDYNEYEKIETREAGGVTFTLKGNGDLIYCALYEKNGCSYSIGSTGGLTWRQIEEMIP